MLLRHAHSYAGQKLLRKFAMSPPSLFPELWEYIASFAIATFRASDGGIQAVRALRAFQRVSLATRSSVGVLEVRLLERFLCDDRIAWEHEATRRAFRAPQCTDQCTLVGRLTESARSRDMLAFLEVYASLYRINSSSRSYRSPRFPHPCTSAFFSLVTYRVREADVYGTDYRAELRQLWGKPQLDAVVSAMIDACRDLLECRPAARVVGSGNDTPGEWDELEYRL